MFIQPKENEKSKKGHHSNPRTENGLNSLLTAELAKLE
jgi:hypothetical protein